MIIVWQDAFVINCNLATGNPIRFVYTIGTVYKHQ